LFAVLDIRHNDSVFPFLSAPETARQLGVSYSLIRYWLRTGHIHGSKIGGNYLVAISEITRFKATPRVRLRKPGPGRPKKIKSAQSPDPTPNQ